MSIKSVLCWVFDYSLTHEPLLSWLFIHGVIHLFILQPSVMANIMLMAHVLLFLDLLLSLSFLTTRLILFTFIYFFSLFLKVLAGMNVHPAEFDGLKQEYNVKGYPTFCYFEWVESSHPSHFRLSLHFQGSEHQSQATSNKKFCPGLLSSKRPDGDRFTPCNGSLQGLELASTRCKVSDKLWDLLVFPLKKVNCQESRLSVQLGVGVGTVWVAMK